MIWRAAHNDDAVASILSQEVLLDISPPRRIGLGWALEPTWNPSVLSVGGRLPRQTEAALFERGCKIEVAVDLADGLRHMKHRRFDVVAVRPTLRSTGDGVRFVRSFKSGQSSGFTSAATFVAKAYRNVAFVILPIPGDSEYALFKSPTLWFLVDANELSLARAIITACSEPGD